MPPRFTIFKDIDKTTLGLFLIMIIIGWVNIFATTYLEAQLPVFNLGTNYGKQLVWIMGAIILALFVLMTNIRFFTGFAGGIYIILLLVLVSVLFFGVEINATKAWFRFGGFAFQPSEIAKYATALALASFLSRSRTGSSKVSTSLKAVALVLLPASLVLLQRDVGTTLVFSAFILVLYREGYISGLVLFFGFLSAGLFVLTLIVDELIIIGLLAVLTLMIGLLIRKKPGAIIQLVVIFVLLAAYVYSVDYAFENFLQPHHKARIEVLIHGDADTQGAGYNLHQSKIAIGSGGIGGKGFLQGTQTQFNFVPEQTTDFIFCTIGEEWGFWGSLLIIGLFCWLLLRLIFLAERQKSTFSRVFGYAVASIIFFHFAINIGMTIGLVPVIGIPLPFISYGGSSLWGFTLLLFTFLKLDARRYEMI